MSGTDQHVVARRVLAYMEERSRFDVDGLERPPAIPQPLFDILCRALRLDPRRRYRTALELGRELSHYLETGEATEEDEAELTQAVRLEDFLALLDAGGGQAAGATASEADVEDVVDDDADEDVETVVYTVGSGEGIRILSSIPVELDFDDQTSAGDVHIPAHDPPPSETGDPELDAVLAELDAKERGES